jgi:GDP-4-dehydro-6-deoxy-D-mannose reductase
VSTALVTGGHGFAGTALRALLREQGWRVASAGRSASRPADDPDERYLRLDVTDAAAVAEAVDAVRPDVVFHLAAVAPQKAGAEVTAVVSGAVAGTLGLCAGLVRAGSVRAGHRTRVVLAGSSAQYGPVPRQDNPVTEETPCRPAIPYGWAKVAAEATALAYSAAGDGLDVVPVRAFNHLGPGEPPTTVAGAFAARVAAVLAGEAQTVTAADLGAVRDFVDVRDIARGYLAAAEHGTPGRAYQLCSGRPTAVGEVLDLLLAAAGLDRSMVDVDTTRPGSAVPYQVGSPARAAAELGWRAELALPDSLADQLTAVIRSQSVGSGNAV